jgi:iron complex outermembrane receptor protein
MSLVSALVFIFFSAATVAVHAQQSSGATIRGTVTDPAGRSVGDAAVVVRNESTDAVNRATTDTQGQFSVTALPAGSYTVEVAASGFALSSRQGIKAAADQVQDLPFALTLGEISESVTVEADTSGSIAAEVAPMDGLLEAQSARTEISPTYIQNFTSPVSDFSELIRNAPGTFSVNANGVGLGDSKTYFRGFADGNYDIDYDNVPFYDTNDPTHHSWVFFPSPWIGRVDFDRSPGTASTTGPTPFGGTMHLISRDFAASPSIRGSVSYGSFGTVQPDLAVDSGSFGFGATKNQNLFADVHEMRTSGFQTYNNQQRNAGSIKYLYKISDTNTLTFYSGVVLMDAYTPNIKGPTSQQVAQLGYNFLLNNDPTSPYYFGYVSYHIPTDVEYLNWNKQFGSWKVNVQPYTIRYYNHQFYDNSTTSIIGYLAIDKVNSYRKEGENFMVSQVSKFGVARFGAWYEYADTNRYQYPSVVTTRVDAQFPNFHERFFTNSVQPFAEYELHPLRKLTITAGVKWAHYNQSLTQYQDVKTGVLCIGGTLVKANASSTVPATCVGGLESLGRSAGYDSYLPSVAVSYHLQPNWTIYSQFAMGSKVPPSSVFDTAGKTVTVLPQPTTIKTVQGGTVLKFRKVTFNADAFFNHFQNAYSSVNDPFNTTGVDWVSAGASNSLGFEGEANVYLTSGLSLYLNGTAGRAKYVTVGNANYEQWVASTPSYTTAIGATYHQKYFDLGMFDKQVGPQWNDNGTLNQVVPISHFNVTDAYINYTIRKGSRLDQTKFRLSVNNLFDQHKVTGISPATAGQIYVPNLQDQLTLLPGRSVMMTVTFGYSPKGL